MADLGLTRVCNYPPGIPSHGPITHSSQYFQPAQHRAAPLIGLFSRLHLKIPIRDGAKLSWQKRETGESARMENTQKSRRNFPCNKPTWISTKSDLQQPFHHHFFPPAALFMVPGSHPGSSPVLPSLQDELPAPQRCRHRDQAQHLTFYGSVQRQGQ